MASFAPSPSPSPTPGPFGRHLLHPGAITHALLHTAVQVVAHVGLFAATPIAATVAIGLVARAVARRREWRRISEAARLVVIEAPPAADVAAAAAFWSHLTGLLRPAWRRAWTRQPHVAFEYTWSIDGIRIAIWVPGSVPPGYAEHAIEAAWPGARTAVEPPSPPIPVNASATGGELRLAQPDWFPLRANHAADPLRPLLTAAADLRDGETAAVQILSRPVTGRRLARARRAATALRRGQSTSHLGRLLDLLTPGSATATRQVVDPTVAGDVRAILDKAAHPTWESVIRYAVTTASTDDDVRARLRGRAHALASAFALFAGRNYFQRRRLRHPATALASRRLGRGDLLSVPELAALAHLPTDVAVPGLTRAGARPVPPPPAVPRHGKVLGDADAGIVRPVAIAPADARQHLHVLGATGSGKSTLLTNLVLGDVHAGRGVVVIDPKGDLVVDILDRLPADCTPVLIDPADADAPPAMNVLDAPDHDLAVDNVVGIFRSIFAAFWGPRTDDVLRAACLTLMRRPGASLADVPPLLTDQRFRAPYLQGLRDPVGLGGFWTSYEAMSDTQRAQVIGPVMNKLRAFLLRDFVRKLLQPPASSFEMADVLDGGLCLVRLPKGVLGEDTARLLGSFVLARVWQAATARAAAGQHARADAAIYIDECQNFLTLPRSFDEMLAEARGYRLSLVLAHQHLAQLGRELREAVSANARNKVFFSLSPEDAHVLARHTMPELGEHDLAHLGAYQAAARLVVDGRETPAFTLRTRAAVSAIPGRADQMRRRSSETFGVDDAARAELQRGRKFAGRRRPGDAAVGSHVGSGVASDVGSDVAPTYDDPFHREHAGQRRAGSSHRNPDSRRKE